MHVKTGNIYNLIPDDLSDEVFEILVQNTSVTIERIISRGHSSPETGWYDENRNEWVMLLKGEARLSFADGPSVNLKAGDFLDIPAHKKHRVDWTDPDTETIWLAIHY